MHANVTSEGTWVISCLSHGYMLISESLFSFLVGLLSFMVEGSVIHV